VETGSCVVIVDDDYAIRDSLRLVMELAGFACQSFESAEIFLESYTSEKHCCLLLDMNMPGMSGLDLQTELIKRKSQIPIIFLSAYSDPLTKKRALEAGAIEFLEKPFPSKELIKIIQGL
jgi:FixJ family two-component response regulator